MFTHLFALDLGDIGLLNFYARTDLHLGELELLEQRSARVGLALDRARDGPKISPISGNINLLRGNHRCGVESAQYPHVEDNVETRRSWVARWRWVYRVSAIRPCRDSTLRTACLKHQWALRHIARGILIVILVKGIEPDNGVRAETGMTPVPRLGGGDE